MRAKPHRASLILANFIGIRSSRRDKKLHTSYDLRGSCHGHEWFRVFQPRYNYPPWANFARTRSIRPDKLLNPSPFFPIGNSTSSSTRRESLPIAADKLTVYHACQRCAAEIFLLSVRAFNYPGDGIVHRSFRMMNSSRRSNAMKSV